MLIIQKLFLFLSDFRNPLTSCNKRLGEDYYVHYKNNKKYWKEGSCLIQENNEWVPAVIYSNESRMIFVRSEREFNEKFTKVTSESTMVEN